MAIEIRTTVCMIFLSGWRSSQIIWITLNWMHPHTVLITQIRNVIREWGSRTHSIFAHFLKDRNCEVCLRTKMTRAPSRRRTGEALHRADKIGDLLTADHKVLNEGCESRDNHWYAVVVQDLGTQWIQSYPVKNKDFKWDGEKFVKILGAVTQAIRHLHWEFIGILENHAKIQYGITALQHLVDPRRVVVLKEWCCSRLLVGSRNSWSLPDNFAVPSAVGKMKYSLICGVNTSFALIRRGWISDAPMFSNSSLSATRISEPKHDVWMSPWVLMKFLLFFSWWWAVGCRHVMRVRRTAAQIVSCFQSVRAQVHWHICTHLHCYSLVQYRDKKGFPESYSFHMVAWAWSLLGWLSTVARALNGHSW